MTPGSSTVEGIGSSCPSAMPRMVLRRILPERVLGSAGHDRDVLERGDGADPVAHELHSSAASSSVVAVDAGLQHHEAARAAGP